MGGLLTAGAHRAAANGDEDPSEDLLDEIERCGCLYFYEMGDPLTGLVRDRAVPGQAYAPGACSIAATGFGLSALAIADHRGYLDHDKARARVRRTLEFLCEGAEHEHGFF